MSNFDQDDGIVLDQETLQLVMELGTARVAKKDAEGREAEARTGILEVLVENVADRGLTGSGATVCHIERQTRRNVNRAKLEAKYPDVYEDVVEEVEIVVLKLD